MNEILACRGCRRNLTDDAGCALCLPVKPHLVVSSEAPDGTLSLSAVAADTVNLLKWQVAKMLDAQRGTDNYDPKVAAEARAVATTIAKLLDASRKVVQDGAEAVTAMPFKERAELFTKWAGSLPAVYRRKLIQGLQALDNPEPDAPEAPEDTAYEH